ncbi:COX4, subunit IV of cytochrome c oxidase [Mycena floridula]|nr:COX4, subunit IV of cytochrome c oxidase [Mycena floridula]
MQAALVRSTRQQPLARATLRRALIGRRLVTTTVDASSLSSSSSSSAAPAKRQSIIPLSNIEAQWKKMSKEDQAIVSEQLEEAMKKDWRQMSLDEKKAAYYVSFGPHGPRTPASQPGDNLKIAGAVAVILGIAGAISLALSHYSTVPHTINKEWEEASNERALEQKMNPISGISSEGYKGKGFVQSK